MKCLFCQNYKISQEGKGREVSIEELADIFLNQQKNGANNINLVTPTMYAYQIIEALKIAKSKGLIIPVIYNTNGYENVETIKALKGYIDVYLPDLKYYSNEIAVKYSKAPNYFEIARRNNKTLSTSRTHSEFETHIKMVKRKCKFKSICECNGAIFSNI